MISYTSKIRARADYRDKLFILNLFTVFSVRSESKNVLTFPILHEENISIPLSAAGHGLYRSATDGEGCRPGGPGVTCRNGDRGR
jgi:hypothetical protein